MRLRCAATTLVVFLAGCTTGNSPEAMPKGESSRVDAESRKDLVMKEDRADAAAALEEAAGPPLAKRQPKRLEAHGDVRVDDYYWLRNREDPEVIGYLEAENRYTKQVMAGTESLQQALFEEMKGRLDEEEESVPYRLGDYFYYDRYPKDGEYRTYYRKMASPAAEEEVVLDVNELAAGHEHVRVVGVRPDEGNTVLGYAIDTVGRRLYSLRFLDLESGAPFDDVIENVTGNFVWANDGRTVFYTRQHPETLRSYQVYRHTLGADPSTDVLLHEESDEEFSAFLWKTKSRRFIILDLEQTLSSESLVLDASDPAGRFQVFHPREENHEYSIDDLGDGFLIRTNWEATNFRLMRAPTAATAKEEWAEVLPHRGDAFVADVEVFSGFLAVAERRDGLVEVQVLPRDDTEAHYLDFGEPAYKVSFTDNFDFDTGVLRYSYTSLTTPESIIDYDLATRQKRLLKEETVLGGFDKADYVTERIWAEARDGTRVPISIVFHKSFAKENGGPLLLYGYGSYGYSIDAGFNPSRLSLLDRGFAFAIAHVRGGQELGRQWYDTGKLFSKMNTFTDFIDCARFLISEGYTSSERLFAMGGSAGGLLMGAVVNLAPDLFQGVVSNVPFVDVVTTMLDADIPLTTSEYDEWGNPNETPYYEYMLSYSPYDRVEAKAYPHILVTAGLHDSQVQYWEPAKYVAKLRRLKTDDNLLLLQTNMEAGHSGASGRFKRYRETALEYAFLFRLAGLAD